MQIAGQCFVGGVGQAKSEVETEQFDVSDGSVIDGEQGNVIEVAVVVCFSEVNGFFLRKTNAANGLCLSGQFGEFPVIDVKAGDEGVNGFVVTDGLERSAVGIAKDNGLSLFEITVREIIGAVIVSTRTAAGCRGRAVFS